MLFCSCLSLEIRSVALACRTASNARRGMRGRAVVEGDAVAPAAGWGETVRWRFGERSPFKEEVGGCVGGVGWVGSLDWESGSRERLRPLSAAESPGVLRAGVGTGSAMGLLLKRRVGSFASASEKVKSG